MHKVTKCEGKGCPLKETCLRFTIPVRTKPRQDYFSISPWRERNGAVKCEFFMPDDTIDPIRPFLTKPKTL